MMKKIIKGFIATLITTSLLSAVFPALSNALSLSWKAFLPSQLLTYVLASKGGLSFGLAFDLMFSGFFLAFAFSALLMRLSARQLVILVLSSVLFIGSLSLGLMAITGANFVLAGPAPLIYCLLTALLLGDDKLKLFLFGLLPVEPRVLVAVLLGLNVIHNLSVGAYMQIAADLSGVIYALAYAVIVFKTKLPFTFWRRPRPATVRKGSDKIIEIHDWTHTNHQK